MRTTLTILALLAGLAGGAARAADEGFVPMSDWQPRAAVDRLAEANRWTVRRIEIHDSCYEIKGRDAEGRPIGVKLHPETLEVIEFEYEGDHDPDGRGHDRKDRKRHD